MATDVVTSSDRFDNFFKELESRKSLLTTMTQLYKTLTDHFSSLEQSLSQKSQALESQIEAFDARTKETLESLESRDKAIPERESAAAARIEEQRKAAISEIEGEAGGGGERSLSEVLRIYCRRMDARGLVRFMLSKRKESSALRGEIASAVEEAADAMRLVLDALEEFVGLKVEAKAGMADRRWACGLLIQVVVPLGESGGTVATSVRERAAGVMEKWKGLLQSAESGAAGAGAGEVTMFLQMVVGFGLKEQIEEEYLRKLVVDFATRRDMAKIAVALGFGDKIKDIIDELVKTGKEIEAVYFVHESGLKEQFPPVSLLKACLRNCRKNASNISKKGNYSSAAVEEANSTELNTTKAIIKCVEDHKLESEFPFSIESLKKRVAQMEKAKADKKKSAASTNKGSKRAHGGGGRGSGPLSFRPPKAGRFSNSSPSFRSGNPPPSHQAAAIRFSAPYNYAAHGMYEGPATASYAPGYAGAHAQAPAAIPQQYPVPSQDYGVTGARVAGSYGGPGSFATQANYGTYDYGGAAGAGYSSYTQ